MEKNNLSDLAEKEDSDSDSEVSVTGYAVEDESFDPSSEAGLVLEESVQGIPEEIIEVYEQEEDVADNTAQRKRVLNSSGSESGTLSKGQRTNIRKKKKDERAEFFDKNRNLGLDEAAPENSQKKA